MLRRGTKKGSALAVAVALSFLIFAIVAASLTRVAASYSQVTMRHSKSAALFLADAGVQKAAHELMSDPNYSGETGTKLSTGRFDVSVVRDDGVYRVVSTGYVKSPLKRQPKMTVRATVRVQGRSFEIMSWRENP